MNEELEALRRKVAEDPEDFAVCVAYVSALIRAGLLNQAEEVLRQMAYRFGLARWPEILRLINATDSAVIVEWGVIAGLPILDVILLFGAGLALPASRMGELTLDDDSDREKWYALMIALYRRHVAERNAYRDGDRTRTITQLWADADYLLRLVEAFLRRYPDYEFASLLRMIARAASGWVTQYWNQDDDWYLPAPAPANVPLPQPQPPPAPPGGFPQTTERPQTFEDWLREEDKAEAQRKRERIARIRQRIRELTRKNRDPRYDYDSVHRTIEGYIDELQKELQKLRDELGAAGEETGEEFDPPLEPPPPAPLPPWPLGHPARPYRLFVNPRTGKQEWFSDPPDSDSGWQPASDYHWGWVPEIDPETGHVDWKPGWVLGAMGPDDVRISLCSGDTVRSLRGSPELLGAGSPSPEVASG